ncbi:hypothetical protein BDW74DRAFT_147604 [Aspergillus multicolor]|uniref:uncharacterized protein n=1 Tax=Aspergillus multicolor TaxID=41759 RepID=UPI003CCD1723
MSFVLFYPSFTPTLCSRNRLVADSVRCFCRPFYCFGPVLLFPLSSIHTVNCSASMSIYLLCFIVSGGGRQRPRF